MVLAGLAGVAGLAPLPGVYLQAASGWVSRRLFFFRERTPLALSTSPKVPPERHVMWIEEVQHPDAQACMVVASMYGCMAAWHDALAGGSSWRVASFSFLWVSSFLPLGGKMDDE